MTGLSVLLGCLCALGISTVSADNAAPADTSIGALPPATAVFAPAQTLELTPAEWDAFHLGRAVDLWQRGDVHGAAAVLEAINVTPASIFIRADRAAFLLAVLYMQLDDRAAFRRVAARAGDANGSPMKSRKHWSHKS